MRNRIAIGVIAAVVASLAVVGMAGASGPYGCDQGYQQGGYWSGYHQGYQASYGYGQSYNYGSYGKPYYNTSYYAQNRPIVIIIVPSYAPKYHYMPYNQSHYTYNYPRHNQYSYSRGY